MATESTTLDANSYWKQQTLESSILLLELDRPPTNSLNSESLRELSKLLDRTENEPELRCLILASAVGDHFLGDTDDAEWERICSSESPQAELVPWHRACSRLASYPVPTIAAIDGKVSGAGIDLALCADIRIAAAGTEFDFAAYARRGTIPYSGGTQRLARAVGKSKALELVIAGAILEASQALGCGLIQRLVDGSAKDEALSLARSIASLDRQAVVAAKTAIASSEVPLAEGLALESRLSASLIATASSRRSEASAGDVDRKTVDPISE